VTTDCAICVFRHTSDPVKFNDEGIIARYYYYDTNNTQFISIGLGPIQKYQSTKKRQTCSITCIYMYMRPTKNGHINMIINYGY
ncbi:MAG: hypothetical protein ACKPKO_15990, partial [Candidatus Fonsibacter sp.]